MTNQIQRNPNDQTENTFELDLPNFNILSVLEKIILGCFLFILALPLLGDYGLWLFPIGRDIIFKLIVEFLILATALRTLLPKSKISMPNDQSNPNIKIPKQEKTNWSLGFWKFIGHWALVIGHLKTPIALSLISFWTIMLLSTLGSVQPDFSLWGNIYKNQGLMTWTHYVLFFVLLVSFLKDPKHWRFLLHAAIFVATAVSLIALWQLFQNGIAFRASSTLNNSNYLASYLVLILPISFAFFLEKKSLLLGVSSLFQLIALISTQARGAILGITVAILLYAILYLIYQKKVTKRKILTLVVVPFLTILGCYLVLVFTPQGQAIQQKLPAFTSRFLSVQGFLSSSAPRLEAWHAGIKGLEKKPLLGYGPENFFVAYDQFYSGFLDHTGTLERDGSLWESWFDKAHNFIFDIGATTGLFGLFAYIMMFASAIWMLRKKVQTVSIGLIAAFAGYLTQNLLEFDTTVTGIYLMLLLAYSSFMISRKDELTQTPNPNDQKMKRIGHLGIGHSLGIGVWGLGFVGLLFLFGSSLKIHGNILKANHELNLAEALSARGQIENAFAAFEKGLTYNAPPINPNLRRRYGVIALAYYDAIEQRCSARTLNAQQCEKLFIDSKKYLARALVLQQENAAKEWPRFTRNYIYAAEIAHILDKPKESDLFFEKALALSPTRASIYVEWARTLKERGEDARAQEKLKKAHEINRLIR